jgi:hypothetical protein
LREQRHELGKYTKRGFFPARPWDYARTGVPDSEDAMHARNTAARTKSTPSISRPASDGTVTPFLEGITINHGPRSLLGRFFLLADQAARTRGITLEFSSMEELVRINRLNASTWRPILPHYDVQYGGLHSENAFCIVGRNKDGEAVATQAARFYDWTQTTLVEEASTLGLFYPQPSLMAQRREKCTITAPHAGSITGRVAFTGAAWYRPDYRGRDLAAVLPRIARAYAFAKWCTDCNITFIAERLVESGLAQRCGYTNVEFAVELDNFAIGAYRGALVWMEKAEMLDDLSRFATTSLSQIDTRVQKRRA